jgi:pSer/pThr/pTyr-binding forkhead associated (FHA) protein
VAFSPDGQWVLAGCDRHLSQWDLVTGTYRRRLEGHTAAVTAVAVSWDGRYAVSGSGDQTLKLWDVANGERIRTLTGHQGVVHAVAFSADGRHIVSGSADHTLKLWDVTSGECLHTLTGHQAAVHAVAFSVDGRYIVSGGADQTLKLWICDWELDDRFPADWDEGARAYLEVFVSQRTPKAALLPADRPPTEAEVALAFQPQGTPAWTETDFQALLRTLQWAGYGWLRPEGIRQQLERMTAAPAKMVFKQPESTVFSTSFGTEFATSFGTGFGTAALTAKVVLAVVEGSLAGQEFEFRDRITCVIGRAKDCDLQLPNDEDHKTVSRYHCQLEIYPPTIRVRDLGSLHGTYVNDRMIGRRRLGAAGEEKDCPDVDLKDGDRIRLGKTVFQVKIVELKTEAIKGAEVDDTGLFANQQLDNDSKQDSQSNNSRSDQTPMSS